MLRFALHASSIVILGVCGCAPAYDNLADTLQTGAEKKIDEGFRRLESDARIVGMSGRNPAIASSEAVEDAKKDMAFASNVKFYADVESDLTTLQYRLEAAGASGKKVAEDVAAIERDIDTVRDLQEEQGTLSLAYISAARQTIDQQFEPLHLYQVLLKGGKSR